MSQVTIHVGFTKAASTFLQAFFANHAGLHYPDRAEVFRILGLHSGLFYPPGELRRYIDAQTAEAAGRPVVLSHERLTGNPHSGYYDCAVIAERIAEARPLRVVIAIREQNAMIASTYKQYVRIGGCLTLAEYMTPPLDGRAPLFDWRVLGYTALVSHYRTLLGPENVLVLPSERLRSERGRALDDLCGFLGVDAGFDASKLPSTANPGIPDHEIDRIRRANARTVHPGSLFRERVLPRWGARWMPPVISPNPGRPLVDLVREALPDAFRESNRRLSELTGLDLEALGYDV